MKRSSKLMSLATCLIMTLVVSVALAQTTQKEVRQAGREAKKAINEAVKATNEDIRSLESFKGAKAISSTKWKMVGCALEGMPPTTAMTCDAFPMGTTFVFGSKGMGYTEYKGTRVSNFNWGANDKQMWIEYIVLMPDGVTTQMVRDQYSIMNLTPERFTVGTQFDQVLKAKVKAQNIKDKFRIDDVSMVWMDFAPVM